MPITDKDVEDLSAIASKKAGPFSSAYGRQFRGGARSTADAAPPPPNVVGGANPANAEAIKAAGMKKGGKTKKYAKGGAIKAQRGDGIAERGKTRGRFV